MCFANHLVETEHDLEQALLLFYNILHTILSKHAPIKSKRIKSNHLPKWINDKVKKAMYERDRFHKLKNWDNYKSMRNRVLHLIPTSKKDYYNNEIQAGTNTTDLWRNLRKIQNNDI